MGKPIPIILPNLTEQEAERTTLAAIYKAAQRARIMESDLPGSGIYETDYFSPPPLKRQKNRKT